MRAGNFFKKSEEEDNKNIFQPTVVKGNNDDNHSTSVQNPVEPRKPSNRTSNRVSFKEFEVLDTEVIKYIIEKFPKSANEIKDSLVQLYNTLENTIDNIEDESSSVIKLKRDFKLSEEYRNKSIKIYNIGQDINNYVNWMNEINKIDSTVKNNSSLKGIITEKDEIMDEAVIAFSNGKKIYEDFTLSEPKTFRLENYIVPVEDWDDLIVKTAEVLTKNYKNNKYITEKREDNIEVVTKKSQQNALRDTVIEMLNEYYISLNDFEVEIADKNN